MSKPIESVTLDRGLTDRFGPGGDLRIVATCGPVNSLQSETYPVIVCQWTEKSPIVHLWSSKECRTVIPILETGRSFSFRLNDVAHLQTTETFTVVCPLGSGWETPRFADHGPGDGQILSVAAVGFLDDGWHDGWIGHISPHKKILSYIPAGGPARLTIPLLPCADGIDPDMVLSQYDRAETVRQVVVASIRSRFADRKESIRLRDTSRDEALAAVLYSQAFPRKKLVFCGPVSRPQLPRPWKALLDSFNANYEEFSSSHLDISEVAILIPPSEREGIRRVCNQPTRILDYREWADRPGPPP